MPFGTHPLNLALRFGLELASLVALGYAARRSSAGWAGTLAMVLVPLVAATLWGLFNVPGDPSRSGKAPVVVPGALRLTLELGFFATATFALVRTEQRTLALLLGLTTVVHYALSLDRIKWLLAR